MTPIEDLEDLSQLVQVPFTAGTVNRGSDLIGAGMSSVERAAHTLFCLALAANGWSDAVLLSSSYFRLDGKRLGRFLWHGHDSDGTCCY